MLWEVTASSFQSKGKNKQGKTTNKNNDLLHIHKQLSFKLIKTNGFCKLRDK